VPSFAKILVRDFIIRQEIAIPYPAPICDKLVLDRSLPQPLLAFAVAVIGGILFARLGWLPLSLQIVGVVVCLIFAALLLFIPHQVRTKKRKQVLILVFLLGGFFFLAHLRYTFVWSCYPKQHVVYYSRAEPRLVTVRGQIIRQPTISKSRGSFGAFDFRHEPRTIFTLACVAIQEPDGWEEVQGKALVVIKRPALNLQIGQEVEIDAWLSRWSGPSNPGQYNRTDRHRASRTLVTLRSGYGEAVKVIGERTDQTRWFDRRRQELQQGAHRALFSEQKNKGEENDAFLTALLLGNREGLYGHLSDIFIRCGSLHFLSVSGLHLGILAGFVWWLGRVVQLPRWLQGLLTLMSVLLFMLIVPERPPILRAGIMSSVFCIAYMIRRKTSALNLLSFAAILILLIQPLDLFNAGFQLSFIVVLGLFVFVPMVYRLEFFGRDDDALERVRQKFRRQKSWWGKMGQWFLESLWRLAAVALVAWLVGMPLSAYHFHRIAPWGALASVLLFVPIAILLLLGFSKILLAFLLPVWSMQLAGPLHLLSDLTIGLAQWLSHFPANQIITAAAPLWFLGIFYLLLVVAGYRVLRGKGMGGAMIAGILIWLIAFSWLVPFRHVDPTTSSFHVLDVGHGCAVIGELGDGSVICYDAGSMSRTDIGSAVILPFLRSRGIGRLDAMFVSHANLDHYCAIPDLCQNMDVKSIYISEYFRSKVKRKNEKSATALLLREIEASGLTIDTLNQGEWLSQSGEANWEIEILWPPANDGSTPLNTNDSSLVLRFEQPGGSLLLAGDIGKIPQRWLLTHNYDALRADVLLLPHHGSITKNLAEFVAAVDPKWIVNSSGFLNERKVNNLREVLHDKPLWHTFIHGAIRIDFCEQGVQHPSAYR